MGKVYCGINNLAFRHLLTDLLGLYIRRQNSKKNPERVRAVFVCEPILIGLAIHLL
jgi:hypothetical protein